MKNAPFALFLVLFTISACDMTEGQNSGLTDPVFSQSDPNTTVQPGDSWTISGDNIFNNNHGNVGIGTPRPAATLDIFSTSATSLNIVNNNGGYGVYAMGNGTEIVGSTSATTASKYGVAGYNTGTTGSNAGVYGSAASPNGYGVYGENKAGGFGFFTPNSSYVGGNIFAPNNNFGPEQVVQCTPGVPCRCPPKTFRTGQLEDETGKTSEMYCQNPFGGSG